MSRRMGMSEGICPGGRRRVCQEGGYAQEGGHAQVE